jgi:hypothetical protein
MLHKTLRRPILTYGSESWPLSKDGNTLRIFERRILTTIYGPIDDNYIRRARYNKLYTLYDESDIVQVIKTGRLQRLGHLFRMQELDSCRNLIRLKPEGTRHVGKPTLRWLRQLRKI